MTDYEEFMLSSAAKNARLVILKALHKERDYRLNDSLLAAELDTFGHRLSREAIQAHLKFLADLGALKLKSAGSVSIAELTRVGMDHLELRIELEGVLRPSPEG